MAALKVALLGAARPSVAALAAALDEALSARNRQAQVVRAAGAQLLPADLDSAGLVLLAGLEFPADAADEAAEQSIRAALAQSGLGYQVLYGPPAERLARALQAIEGLLPPAEQPFFARQGAARPASAASGSARQRPWVWMCDKCSDPQCEHQLLTALLAGRTCPPRLPETAPPVHAKTPLT